MLTWQRYATSVTTGFVIRELSRKANIGVQEFMVKPPTLTLSLPKPYLSPSTPTINLQP